MADLSNARLADAVSRLRAAGLTDTAETILDLVQSRAKGAELMRRLVDAIRSGGNVEGCAVIAARWVDEVQG